MKAVCEKFNFAGANAFSGEPLTATNRPWFIKDAAFQVSTALNTDALFSLLFIFELSRLLNSTSSQNPTVLK